MSGDGSCEAKVLNVGLWYLRIEQCEETAEIDNKSGAEFRAERWTLASM